jgi:hypothetical protein
MPWKWVDIECEEWLRGCADNKFSQYGEDGLIDAVLNRIGCANRWCFEVGAFDGTTHSNVRRLMLDGWSGVLIEANADSFIKLQALYDGVPNAHLVRGVVTPRNIDAILEENGAPRDMDLGVIDIDEQDFWVWAGMRNYQPRLMLVEFGMGRPTDGCPPLRRDGRDPSYLLQAGRNKILELGWCLGYDALALTACNMLFCRTDLYPANESVPHTEPVAPGSNARPAGSGGLESEGRNG